MNTNLEASPSGESETKQKLIAARILDEERLRSIVDESIMEFLMGVSKRTPFDIAIRILLLIGAVGSLVGSATFGFSSLVAFFALCGTLEAIRANRRIDALLKLQDIANKTESVQIAP